MTARVGLGMGLPRPWGLDWGGGEGQGGEGIMAAPGRLVAGVWTHERP